jgi:hypothetical protein
MCDPFLSMLKPDLSGLKIYYLALLLYENLFGLVVCHDGQQHPLGYVIILCKRHIHAYFEGGVALCALPSLCR